MTAPSAGAASGGSSEWAKRCQTDYTALGFRNAGQCVSHHARGGGGGGGGGVVTGLATLTLTFDSTPCASYPNLMCTWSVQGSGPTPGSQVIVGESTVSYGAAATVGSTGTVSVQGIYMRGDCVVSGYEHVVFVARGVAADGTPIASAEVAGDYTQFIPICV